MDLYGLPGYPSFSNFIKRDKTFLKLKKLYSDFQNGGSSFKYIEFYDGMIQLTDFFNGTELFAHGEPAQEFINQEYTINGEPAFYSNVRAAVIGENTLSSFGISPDTVHGEYFTLDDFNLKDKKIKVILGNEYKDLFRLNQVFKALYMGVECKFQIISFLESGFEITIGNTKVDLDYYVLVPGFNIENQTYNASNDRDKKFYNMHYINKTECFIHTSDMSTITPVRNKLEQIYLKRNLKFSALPVNCEFRPITFPSFLFRNVALWFCIICSIFFSMLYCKQLIFFSNRHIIKTILIKVLLVFLLFFVITYNTYSQRLVIYNACIWGSESILILLYGFLCVMKKPTDTLKDKTML